MLTHDAKRNSDLSEDVILEILLRLPVKTLSRFKCVCKHWYTLIGSRSFVNQHFGHESNQERLLVRNYKPNEDPQALALFVDEICSEYEEPDHLKMPNTVNDLIGPVNGVFCVVSRSSKMALLNPAMRQFRPLPSPDPDVKPHLLSVDNVLGFGLDTLSEDYKLVSIQYFWNEEMHVPHDTPLVSVYSLGGDSWRHFEDVGLDFSSHCASMFQCNTYLDGVCYWFMESDKTNTAILAFDMTTEKFQEIQVPDGIKSKAAHLTLYDDSIALLSYPFDKIDKCDVWVMKEEGCWTKSSIVIPFEDIIFPLCFWKNNELLLETESALLTLYNISTQKLRTIEGGVEETDAFIFWVFSYKESLVSIKGEANNCMLWDASSDFIKYFLDK